MILYQKISYVDDKVQVLFINTDSQEYSKEVILKGHYKSLEKDNDYQKLNDHLKGIEYMMQFKKVDNVNTKP